MSITMKGDINRKDIDKAFRGLVLQLYKEIIRDTPVDTGRARGNWQLAVGSAPSGEASRLEKGQGGNQLREANTRTSRPLEGKSIFIANNLPYIVPLEEGHSKQGKGFVQRAMDRAEARVLAME